MGVVRLLMVFAHLTSNILRMRHKSSADLLHKRHVAVLAENAVVEREASVSILFRC